MINYLFSGIDKEKGFTKKQSEFLTKDILPNSNITFIASIFDNYDKNDKQICVYKKLFEDIGIIFKKINLIDSRLDVQQSQDLLKSSDIIFLLGGFPELQMKSIQKYGLLKYIRKSNFILSVSAGSMNQSKRVMYKDDFDNFIMKDYAGIGIVNINIFPHVESEDSSLFEEAKEISYEMPLILLPNDSFIRIKDEELNIIGKSYYLYNGQIK